MRLVLLSLLVFSTFLSSNAQVNLTQGLMAYYPFNGNTGDSSGNSNNPVFNNATLTTDRFGVANHAYSFNGVNNYMQIPNSASLNTTTSISVCAWVKVNGFNYASCHGNRILYKSDIAGGTGNYGIEFSDKSCATSTPDTLHETLYGLGTTGSYNNYVQRGNWFFVVNTYDGTKARMFVNGQIVDSATVSISTFSNTYDLYLGKFNNSGGLYWMNASLDDIRIYSRAINTAEINALYTPATPPVSLTQGLMAWYPFNGNTGDSSGNANHVTVNNNATLTADRFGNANSAYSFDGASSYMKVLNSPSLNVANSISVCTWVKVKGFNYASCHGNTILYKSDVNAGLGNYGIQFSDIKGGLNCSSSIPDTLHETFYGDGTTGNYASNIQKNVWYFVVSTFDGAIGKTYINGQLVDSISETVSSFANAYDLYIGRFNGSGGTFYINGVLDDIRIYSRVISQAEINALYTPAPTPTSLTQGLMAYYPFNGNTGDSSGNANHVTVNNNATLTTDRFGNANSAYSFNGANSYMKVLNSPSLNVANSISVCTWIKVNGFNYASCHGNRILYKSDIDAGAGNYGIDFSDRSCVTSIPDTLHELFYGDGTLANYSSYIQKNTWYFVVSTFDGVKARSYINGQLVDSNAATVSSFTNAYDLYIGKLNSGAGLYFLNGVLDDIRIYSRAITQSEINALYTPGTTSLPVNLIAFTAAKNKSDVDVSWQVGSEINHAYYEVERSFDALNYTSITKVTGIYNNSGGSYIYTDANILSLTTSPQIYYRLKMVSKTGDVTYSNVVHVSTTTTISEVSTYPNPFQYHVVLNMTFQKSGPVGITITDMSGKIVNTQTINVPQGNTTININNLANVAKGLYILRITNADTVITKKILKGE